MTKRYALSTKPHSIFYVSRRLQRILRGTRKMLTGSGKGYRVEATQKVMKTSFQYSIAQQLRLSHTTTKEKSSELLILQAWFSQVWRITLVCVPFWRTRGLGSITEMRTLLTQECGAMNYNNRITNVVSLPIVLCPHCDKEQQWDDCHALCEGSVRACHHCEKDIHVLDTETVIYARVSTKPDKP